VDSPAELFAAVVPDLTEVTGPVLACSGERGVFRYSNGGFAVLGQLIADVTGQDYPQAATRLVLAPLGLASATFPASWPPDSVTGYQLTQSGLFRPAGQVSTLPAAGGLWSTAADLVRFGQTWATLLPAELAREALTPQADRTPGLGQIGLGWLLNQDRQVAGHAGGAPGAATSLILRAGQVNVALTNRLVPIEPVNARLANVLA
jgi:CubicO group peptidase (beta-lactamase class C family)